MKFTDDPITYSLAPIPFWNFLDLAGDEAVNGSMETFRDNARNEHKATYQDLLGTIPYSNPIVFDGRGTIPGPIYWATDELYYLVIRDSSGNIIRTVQHFGPTGSGGSGPVTNINSDVNYLVNGQFRFNQGTIANSKFVANTPIKVAEGGWDFIKNNITATDQISFPLFNLGDTVPEGTPIYYCAFTCSGVGSGESFKYFRFKIPDVRFEEAKEVTFSLQALSPQSLTIQASVTQHFGTGGSPSADVTTPIVSMPLITIWKKFTGSIPLPSVGGKTLGTNKDDCLYITIAMPLNQTGVINFVNAKFQDGNLATPYLPDDFNLTRMETMGSQIPVPAVDGTDNNKFLQVQNDPTGGPHLVWGDATGVGQITFDSGNPSKIDPGYLICDGSKYLVTGKSTDNIPYIRLFNKYITGASPDAKGPQWGNGYDYLSAWTNSDNKIRVINNNIGAVSPLADGTAATGFTFTNIQVGSNTNYNAIVYYKEGTNNFLLKNTLNSGGGTNGPGNSGFTFLELQSGNDFRKEISWWTIPALPAVNTYFQYFSGTTQYYVWFKVNGAGTDPAPGGTGIVVNILSGDSTFDVNLKIAAAVNQEELTYVTTVAASAMTASSYFKAFSTGNQMYYWYKINGVGTDPAVPGYTGIEVDLDGTETNVDVASKTSIAMMNAFVQVPDLRGRTLIGLPLGVLDPDAQYRASNNASVWGDQWGTYGEDFIAAHKHSGGHNQIEYDHNDTGTFIPDETVLDTDVTGRYRNMMLNAGGTFLVKY